jgi:uncharacterized protein YktA (UPF0223 family)
MKSMLYMTIFLNIYKDYKTSLKQKKDEKKCNIQFNKYLTYLKFKNIKINNYVSIGDTLK